MSTGILENDLCTYILILTKLWEFFVFIVCKQNYVGLIYSNLRIINPEKVLSC